jgi:4-hydroxy-2-oxoheptanedioate aldolase
VVAAVEKGIETIVKAGKAAGVLAVDKALAEGYASKGASFVGVGVDASLLATSVRNLASQFCSDDKSSSLTAGY